MALYIANIVTGSLSKLTGEEQKVERVAVNIIKYK